MKERFRKSRERVRWAVLFTIPVLLVVALVACHAGQPGNHPVTDAVSRGEASETGDSQTEKTDMSEKKEKPVLTEEQEAGIKRAFLNRFVDESEGLTTEDGSVRCYGIFGQAYAVFVDGFFGYADVIAVETVRGLRFLYPSMQPMYIYADSQFFRLREALDGGVLTEDDLQTLYETYKGWNQALYDEDNQNAMELKD